MREFLEKNFSGGRSFAKEEIVESEDQEKREEWEALRAKVDNLADRLGRGVDEGIKEDVTAFQAMGLETTQSCEGHADPQEGYHAPGIDIGIEPPDDFLERLKAADYDIEKLSREDREEYDRYEKANEEQNKKLRYLLEEFYKDRDIPEDLRLGTRAYGHFSMLSVRPGLKPGKLMSDPEDPEEISQNLDSYREEMHAFRNFLRSKFFSS